jgi:hypothetical protein
MKVHIGMQGQPAILLGLVRIEMNDVHFPVATRCQDIAHEIEKLGSPPSGIMTHLHLAGGNPSRAADRISVPFVAEAESVSCFAARQPQPSLGSL